MKDLGRASKIVRLIRRTLAGAITMLAPTISGTGDVTLTR
jgi:hypothetical protein